MPGPKNGGLKARAHPPPPHKSAAQRWGMRVLYLAVFWGICSYLNSINARFYSFTPEVLNECVQNTLKQHGAKSNDTGAIISTLLEQLTAAYPDAGFQVDYRDTSEWVFNNAAGAMGSMYIIHASITEYLIIFGSAVGTEGHTGRHTADDYFHILTGQQTAYEAGALMREIYNPGDVHHMHRGVAKQYAMIPETWALEYARGWIPLMLPMGYADTFTSTLDIPNIWATTYITGREMIKNLLRGKI